MSLFASKLWRQRKGGGRCCCKLKMSPIISAGCAQSQDFNLDLQEGELVGIIGPNGAGKTTVFNLITGVYKSTQGSIRFQDTELVGKKPEPDHRPGHRPHFPEYPPVQRADRAG